MLNYIQLLSGEGAIVLSLNNDSFASFDKLKEEKKICNIMIKTRKGKSAGFQNVGWVTA